MSRDQQSTAELKPALKGRAGIVGAPSRPAPLVYWNLCQGVPPVVIESPRIFLAAQAIVVVLGVAIIVVILLIF
jgi:hypothetical protein